MFQRAVSIDMFKWKTRDRKEIYISEIDTDYLFNILLMVWNHTATDDVKIKPYKHYNSIGAFYSYQYRIQTIMECIKELKTRNDIDINRKEILEFILSIK